MACVMDRKSHAALLQLWTLPVRGCRCCVAVARPSTHPRWQDVELQFSFEMYEELVYMRLDSCFHAFEINVRHCLFMPPRLLTGGACVCLCVRTRACPAS